MTLKKYNQIQINHILCYAILNHEDIETAAFEWVEKYSAHFSEVVKSLGIKVN